MKSKFIIIFFIYMLFFATSNANNNAINLDDDFFDFADNTTTTTYINDPYEKFNRKLYAFYIGLYPYTFKPLVPIYAKKGPYIGSRLNSFKQNLNEPKNIINHILQGRVNAAVESTFRFVVNSSVGLLGFFDVMSHLGLAYKQNDFGATLYFYGVPNGPYLVLIGPFSLRDSVGIVAGWSLSFSNIPTNINFTKINAINHVATKNQLSLVGTATVLLDSALIYNSFQFSLKQSLDEYSFVKNSMQQIRQQQLQQISQYD